MNFGVFLIATTLSVVLREADSVFHGCYPDTPGNRQFGVNPGNYNPADVTPVECEDLCGRRGYPYAGLTAGKICLCGSSLTQGVVSDSLCPDPCPGDTSSTCGSSTQRYFSVYTTPQFLTGFRISAPAFIEAYAFTTINFNITSGIVSAIRGQFHDGGPSFGPGVDMFTTVSPRKPGLIPMEAIVTDTTNYNLSASTIIGVQSRVKLLDLDCPNNVVADIRFDCYVTVGVGTHMTSAVDMGDGNVIPIRLPDTRALTTGDLDKTVSTVTHPGSQLYLMPEHFLRRNGTIVGVDYVATTAGDIIIQVYRPSCTNASFVYCHNSYSCIPADANCMAQERGMKWRYACGQNAIYNIARRRCVDKTTHEIIPDPVVQDWSTMEFQTYELMKEITITIPSPGRHFHTVPDSDLYTTSPGDVLAILETGGSLQLFDASNGNHEFFWDVSADPSFASRHTAGFNLTGSTPTTLSAQHALKVYYTIPVRGKIRHTYAGGSVDRYNVTLSVSNDVTVPPAVWETEIGIQVPVQNLAFTIVDHAATNSSVQFNISDHIGTDIVYTWSFGDGEHNVTTEKFLEKTYTAAGVYSVTLTAHNDISSQTVQKVIIIQDSIQNFTAELDTDAVVYTNPATVVWTILQGTNVSYACAMGDGHVYFFGYPFSDFLINQTVIHGNGTNDTLVFTNGTSDELGGFISHIYDVPDWYFFSITASNLVSETTINISIPVQTPIEGLEIATTPSIAYGTDRNVPVTISKGSHTDITITLNDTFLNESYLNWNTLYGEAIIRTDHYEFYGPYIITANVTNLVSPYITFSREVWVDFSITDLFIYIDRPFVPVSEDTSVNISMSRCSRFHTYLNFSDGSAVSYRYQELILNDTYTLSHAYMFPGTYYINLTIMNPVDSFNDTYVIVVQYPVVSVETDITNPNRLEIGKTSPVFLQLEFMGGVPLPTDATYNIDFKDGNTFSDDFIEIIPTTAATGAGYETTESTTVTVDTFECRNFTNSSLSLNETYLEQCNMTYTTQIPVTLTTELPTTAVTEKETTQMPGYFLIPVTHHYSTIGTYNVTINVTNLVNYMFFSFVIEVDEPIYDLTLTPNPVYVKRYFYSNLEASMSWGSRANCTWIIGDGSPPIVDSCDRHSVAIQTWQFSTVGVFLPILIANNSVTHETVSSILGPIYVQEPVVGFSVVCNDAIGNKCERNIDAPTYAVTVNFRLLFDRSNPKPTNASYIIDFGDGTVTTPTELNNTHQQDSFTCCPWRNLVFDFSHVYRRGGNFSVNVIIWNLVSNETYEVLHDIYEMLENLDVTIYDYDPDTVIQKLGGGIGKDYFALEHEVLFEASHSRGSHVTYQWTFGDGTSPVTIYYDKQAFHQYDDDIFYYTNLTASNRRNSLSVHKKIYIQRGCFDIAISVDAPRSKNSTFRYQFFPGTIGSDACYLFDFQDETSSPGRYQMLGNQQYCETLSEWSWVYNHENTTFTPINSDILYYNKTVSSPTNYNLTVDTMFLFEGLYDVTLQCKNYVSHETAEYRTGVTKGPCWWPYVNLTAPNVCSYPNCDPAVEGLRNVKRSEKLVVYSDVKINCTSTDVSWYGWRVFLHDEEYGNETEIFDLGGADTYSIACRYLQIEPRVLEYGLYRFELNVSMHEQMGMFTLDSTYIRITSTPLVVNIAGGDFFTGKWGDENPMVFDGFSEVFDPDREPEDKSGMEFIWLCRRTCEEWPDFDENYDVPDPSTMVTTCEYQEGEDRGCSKVDGVNHAGKVPNASFAMLEVMTGEMYESDYIEIKLVVRKDNRVAEDSAMALILTGDPPEISLYCVTNCGKKMNPTNRYSLKSQMKGWTRGVFFYYEWKLYGIPWGRSYVRRQEIPYSEWEDQASTGVAGPHMALIPVVSRLTSNQSQTYYLSVKAWRWGTSKLNYGMAQISFRINEKPSKEGASVTVNPTSGEAYKTTFVVSADGFSDYENGQSFSLYKFGFKRDVTDPVTWFFESSRKSSYGRDTRFPDGLESRQFKLDIVVRAYDWDGAFTEKWSRVTVHPAQPTDVENILDTATEPGGLADKLLMASDLQVAPVADVIGKFLNDEADGSMTTDQIIQTTTQIATEQNMTEADRLALQRQIEAEQQAKKDRRVETRTHFMKGFKRIKPPNVEAMQGTASALSSMTKKEDELSEEAQIAAADIMEDYMNNLESQGDLSADDREEAATGLTQVLGNVMHACGYSAEKAELEATALADNWMATTTAAAAGAGVPGSTTTSAPLTEAEFALQQKALLDRKDQAKANFERLESSMNKMIGLLSKYKVVGESKAVAESEKLNITLEKTETQLVNNNPTVPVGGKTSVLLPKTQTIFGEADNATTWFVETEALRIPNNPFTWTNTSAGGSSTKITSDVITLKFRNDTGGDIPVKDSPQYFDLFIDRSNFDTSVQSIRNVTYRWSEPMVIHTISIQPQSSFHIKVDQLFKESDIQDYLDYLDSIRGVTETNSTDENATEIASFFMETEPSQFYVFIRANEPPTVTEYDFNCTLSKEFSEVIDMLSYMDSFSFENDTSLPRSLYITDIPDLNTCFYSSKDLQLNETTTFYIGIKHKTYAELDAELEMANQPSTTQSTAQTTTPTPTTTTEAAKKKRRKRQNYSRRRNYSRWRQNSNAASTTVGPTQPPENLEDILEQLFEQQFQQEEEEAAAEEAAAEEEEKNNNNNNNNNNNKKKKIIPEGAYKQAVYTIQIFSASCVWWDKSSNVWTTSGCVVGPLCKPFRVHCLCDHLTAFGAGFAVPMNSINLDDSGFSKLDENPVIFATMVSVMCAYVLMLIWARKRDLADKVMAGASPLPDNDPRDKYFYELTVFTGSRKDAGTTAKISFVLTGEKEETPPRYLADERRPVLQRSNCDGFVMAVPKCLGKLTHLRVWHDNMGSNPSWYFSRMQIQDLQTGDKYFFICEQWLSVDDEDGLIDRMVPVAGKAELTSFNYLFWTKTKHNLADGHLWFSVFQRPARSNFTRVQRLTCCLALLFSTMVASIAFYQTGSKSPQEYKIGPMSFTMEGLYIGILSGLMCFPINLVIVFLFRYAKPAPEKKKKKVFPKHQQGKEKNSIKEKDDKNPCLDRSKSSLSLPREKSDIKLDFAEDELEQQKKYLETGDESKRVMSNKPPTKETEFPHNAQILAFEKDGKRKSKGKLPHFCIYIAYGLSLVAVGVAFFFSVEFGGVFGKKKALEWLLSFFISFFESVFFSQPIKVVILAIFYALVIKKPEANEDEAVLPTSLSDDEELLHKPLTEKDLEDPKKLKMLEDMKAQAPLPPEMDFLETIRKERAKELAMYSMLKEVAICLIFINFVLTIAYANRDPWSYKMYMNYDNIFNKATFSNNYSMTFTGVNSLAQFWNWTENALLDGLYTNTWYNGDSTADKKLTQDMQTFLIGGARLRQLRIIPDLCYSPLNYFTAECMREYSMTGEQIGTYGLNWVDVNDSDPLYAAHPFFTYQDWSALDGYPYWGIFATYSGGGYVAELGTTYNNAKGVIEFLKDSFWVDKYTRAVFIEANLYNPNHNLWGISMYLCEFLQTGAVEPFPRFHIFRLDRYYGDFMYFVMFVEIVTIAFIIFYTVKEVRKLQAQGIKYFKEFWNSFEVVILFISYALILVFIYRAVVSVQLMTKIKDNPAGFTNFYFAVLLDDLSGWFVGILVFLLTIRFMRLLRFNKKISLLSGTLRYTAKPLMSFMVVFMLAFLSFACTAYLFFMATLYDFRSYMTTIETLLSMMLGKFDYDNAMRSRAGPFMFGFFSLCFSFILINFFLTILIDGFERVRSDPQNQTNDHEVIDYLMKKLKLIFGIDKTPRKKTPQFVQDPRLSKYVYIEGKTDDQKKIGELDNKVDVMIKKMEDIVGKPEEEDDIEKEIEEVKKKRKRKIVGSE